MFHLNHLSYKVFRLYGRFFWFEFVPFLPFSIRFYFGSSLNCIQHFSFSTPKVFGYYQVNHLLQFYYYVEFRRKWQIWSKHLHMLVHWYRSKFTEKTKCIIGLKIIILLSGHFVLFHLAYAKAAVYNLPFSEFFFYYQFNHNQLQSKKKFSMCRNKPEIWLFASCLRLFNGLVSKGNPKQKVFMPWDAEGEKRKRRMNKKTNKTVPIFR